MDVNDEPEYVHQRKWVDACKAGFGSEEHNALISSFDYAGPMTEMVLMGNLAIRSYLLKKENEKGKTEFFGRKNYRGTAKTCELPILRKPADMLAEPIAKVGRFKILCF